MDEVIVFEDTIPNLLNGSGAARDHFTGWDDPNYFLMHLLSYLETPPFLRTRLFPLHPDLKYAGSLPSIDMPHHLRANDVCPYREGMSIRDPDQPEKEGVGDRHEENQGSKKKPKKSRETHNLAIEETTHFIDVGFPTPVQVSTPVPLNNRLTIHFTDPTDENSASIIVQPSAPREKDGYYWGYSLRAASSISSVLTECPFDGGYDITIGTSERGIPISEIQSPHSEQKEIPPFRHLLVTFGGLAGLEAAVAADKDLVEKGIEAKELFDFWVNVCPKQGSRTIRTEEAIWVALAQLKEAVDKNGEREKQKTLVR